MCHDPHWGGGQGFSAMRFPLRTGTNPMGMKPSGPSGNWKICVGAGILILAHLFIPLWDAFPQELPEISTEDKIARIREFRRNRNEFLRTHPRSPLSKEERKEFRGLDVYPINLQYVFVGKIDRYHLNIRNPDYYAAFPTNKGTNKRYIRYGKFTFELDGAKYTLELYKSILSDYLFVPFRDKTNGDGTYEMGRYIDAEILPGYHTIIDFNMAYSPNCMFNENSICPIPPQENFLPKGIVAGEKKYVGQPETSQ